MDIETIEMELLLRGIKSRYGYDFTSYSQNSLKRRLHHILEKSELKRFTQLLDKVLHDTKSFDFFLQQMSVTVTEIFRDPKFYLSIRKNVIPVLKTFPFIKIWHAGCATGEEVYSMAILLHEEGFLERTQIYATDFNNHSLDIASKGVYRKEYMDKFHENYKNAGGKCQLEDYYSSKYDFVKFNETLKKRITFSNHNLVADGIFGEMHLICCRNVMIYFDAKLQNHVLLLFSKSLHHSGFLCLGNNETINFSDVEHMFKTISKTQRIFKKEPIGMVCKS